VQFVNFGHRPPYPTDPFQFWLAKGAPPRNVSVALAHGAWIAVATTTTSSPMPTSSGW
jgi:hypothetical protein